VQHNYAIGGGASAASPHAVNTDSRSYRSSLGRGRVDLPKAGCDDSPQPGRVYIVLSHAVNLIQNEFL